MTHLANTIFLAARYAAMNFTKVKEFIITVCFLLRDWKEQIRYVEYIKRVASIVMHPKFRSIELNSTETTQHQTKLRRINKIVEYRRQRPLILIVLYSARKSSKNPGSELVIVRLTQSRTTFIPK